MLEKTTAEFKEIIDSLVKDFQVIINEQDKFLVNKQANKRARIITNKLSKSLVQFRKVSNDFDRAKTQASNSK